MKYFFYISSLLLFNTWIMRTVFFLIFLSRNVETIIGGHVAGKGKPFLIFIYGSQKLKPMYP